MNPTVASAMRARPGDGLSSSTERGIMCPTLSGRGLGVRGQALVGEREEPVEDTG
jgi:hypothetical protein